MAYAVNAGVRIHYSVEGDGPPLVLQHGFLQSIADWHEAGVVAALRRRFRLVMLDARGHGGSDKPHDEAAYTIDKRVGDVCAVLDAEGIGRAPFWGYSMGGYYAYAMGVFAPERVSALIIGGQHPFDRVRSGMHLVIEAAMKDGPDAVVEAIRPFAGLMPPGFTARLRAGDHAAFAAMSFDEAGIAEALATMAIPTLLYCGDADVVYAQNAEAARLIPGARFVKLPGVSHMEAFYQADVVVAEVIRFLGG